jgi:hypothetical protein
VKLTITACNGSWAFLRSASPLLRKYVSNLPPKTLIGKAVDLTTRAIDERIHSLYEMRAVAPDFFQRLGL